MHCRLLLVLMLLNASTAWSSDFDVDNDGVVAPLTDGLLVLRHFFGFTGTALTQGRAWGGCNQYDGRNDSSSH